MRWVLAVCLSLAALGCTSPPAPTAAPTTAPTPNVATLPLPPNTSGIPGPEDFGFEIASNTTPGMVPVGEEQIFILGHCGLISPIDIDGSLWDPIAGDNGQGGPLSEDQLGELINSTTVVIVLVDADTAMFVTPRGARIVLDRHDGPRSYFGCD